MPVDWLTVSAARRTVGPSVSLLVCVYVCVDPAAVGLTSFRLWLGVALQCRPLACTPGAAAVG